LLSSSEIQAFLPRRQRPRILYNTLAGTDLHEWSF
jgi:hypothetical protein